MVAYLYPPIENTGTRRIVKFVKYLPGFGYRPVILTTRTRGSSLDDAQNLIWRADDWVGVFRQAYRAFKLRCVPSKERANTSLLPRQGWIQRARARLFIPDPEIIWYPPAVRQGHKLLRALPIRLIYSTSSPETNHLVALALKRKTCLPWVADFRDGWMFEPLRAVRLTWPPRQRVELNLERRVVLGADRIVTVNDTIARDLARRYPQAAAKVVVIPNGYDLADFAGLGRESRSRDKLRLVHTGALSVSRRGTKIDGLLSALQTLPFAILSELEIELVGNLSTEEVAFIEQSGVGDCFVLRGQVPHRQALQYQVNADVLLLVVAPQASGISTTKLFEYLATGRPILALSGDSEAAQMVSDLASGLVVAPDDIVGIQKALIVLHERWKRGHLRALIDERVRQFERRRQSQKLASVFDELMVVRDDGARETA